MEKHLTKRIEWIDIAKAICILLMVAGHVYPYGSTIRNTIFSFHMPLFFILSGYTFHFEKTNKKEWIRGTVKDIKRLYLPVLIVLLIDILGTVILFHPKGYLQDRLMALFWASGAGKNIPILGVCWFLVSMFWARVLIRTLLCFFDKDKVLYFCIGLGALASIHFVQGPLLQNFDVTAMVMMLLAIGHLWKKHDKFVESHQYIFAVICAIFWTFCLSQGWYIEIATRSYPMGMLSVLEAMCGTFVCCSVSDAISTNKYIKRPFLFLGKHTLIFLCIHCLDKFWKNYWQISSSPLKVSIVRIVLDLVIWFIVVLIKLKIENLINNKKKC